MTTNIIYITREELSQIQRLQIEHSIFREFDESLFIKALKNILKDKISKLSPDQSYQLVVKEN